jgi:hypothetical protein
MDVDFGNNIFLQTFGVNQLKVVYLSYQISILNLLEEEGQICFPKKF